MKYRKSKLDADNKKWFENDGSVKSLRSLEVFGKIRGLNHVKIKFDYPITAIAGRNGTGKTTVLALCACSFHNEDEGYSHPDRHNKMNYYTFGDFFIQTSDEVPVEGIGVVSGIFYDSWYNVEKKKNWCGVGYKTQVKRVGGRWTNYDRRVPRVVLYFGINRVMPHSEKSVSKSYKSVFKIDRVMGWEGRVCRICGRVLGQQYGGLTYKKKSKYRIPLVNNTGNLYSGFNMGAGENALIELFSVLLDAPDGALVLIDEIELGLHEDAQGRLILELKKLCKEKHMQVVCTTHSPRILDSLPPEGRIFIETYGEKNYVIPGITTPYATGKLTGEKVFELDILVEDDVSKSLVSLSMNSGLRKRVNVLPVGSCTSISRHMAMRYVEGLRNVCAIYDGDKKKSKKELLGNFNSAYELKDGIDNAKNWFAGRISFFEGDAWPEKWVFEKCLEGAGQLAFVYSEKNEIVKSCLHRAMASGRHNEFYEMSKLLCVDINDLMSQMIRIALLNSSEYVERLRETIRSYITYN